MNANPLVWREHDARHINMVLNHPVVRPWVADVGEGVLDINPIVQNENNVLLMGEHGGCLFFCPQPGVYEVHTQVLPEGRGPWALDFVRGCARWMFTRTPAFEITTRVPHGHIAAKALTIAAGMRYEFTRDDGPVFRGRRVGVDIFSYRVQDWMQSADEMIAVGADLHAQMHAEAARLGITDTPHEDDENHNRYAGAALEMAMNGQIKKGVLLYNRWAFSARHALIALKSIDPPIIKFDIGYLCLKGGKIEVLREC